jgi:hypothetical protein
LLLAELQAAEQAKVDAAAEEGEKYVAATQLPPPPAKMQVRCR